jgi:Stress responsive A/B Barrel Domain
MWIAFAMYSLTRLLDVSEDARDRLLGELREAAAAVDALRWVVQPTLRGARNGGDILLHLRFATKQQRGWAAERFATLMADPTVNRVNGADYSGVPVRRDDTPGTVYRTLLLRVVPETDADTVARFEHELSLMPRYVSTIRAWQLSRVSGAVGTTEWTHVFEQEFCDVDGLVGPYLMHPIHWAVVDRWFDPETAEVIVRDRVCHSFCAMDGAMLS